MVKVRYSLTTMMLCLDIVVYRLSFSDSLEPFPDETITIYSLRAHDFIKKPKQVYKPDLTVF